VTDGFVKYYHFIDAIFLALFFIDVLSKPEKVQIFFQDNLYASSMLFFSLFLVISFFWSPNTDKFLINILLQGSLILNSVALFYFVNKYNLIKYILYSYIVFALINNLICLNIISNGYFSSTDAFEGMRFVGTGLGANNLAIDLIFSTFITLMLIIITKKIIIKNVCILNILLTIYTILLTQSRKGIIFFSLLIILFLIYYLMSYQKNKALKLIYLLGILCVISISIHDIISEVSGPAVERLSGLYTLLSGGYGDESAEIRSHLIKIGWNSFADRPFTGYGQDAFAYYNTYYSHNNFIEILYNLGLVGFILYYLMYVRFFIRLQNPFFKKRVLFIGVCLIILLMDSALVSYNVRSHMLFLTILSVMIKRENQHTPFSRKKIVLYKVHKPVALSGCSKVL
jgi:O-antigen ligase